MDTKKIKKILKKQFNVNIKVPPKPKPKKTRLKLARIANERSFDRGSISKIEYRKNKVRIERALKRIEDKDIVEVKGKYAKRHFK